MRHAIPTALACALALAPLASAGDYTPGSLWVSAQDDHQVEGLRTNLNPIGVVGAGGDLVAPSGVAFGPDGRLYVVSSATNRVLVYDDDGDLVDSLGADSGLSLARGLAFGPDGNLYVGDGASNVVRVLSPDGAVLGSVGAGSGMINPVGLAFGRDGHLFIASGGAAGGVLELDPSGTTVGLLGGDSDLLTAGGLALGPAGRLYVSSTATDSVLVFDADGAQVDELGADDDLDSPGGLAFGPDGLLYVASNGNNRVLVFDLDGELVDSVAGVGGACQIAFAPWRMGFNSKGTLVDAEGAKTVKQSGVLSIELGSQRAMLSLDDGAVADLLGRDVLVLAGVEAGEDANAKSRGFVGSLNLDNVGAGMGSLALQFAGKLGKKSGAYELKKAKGSWILSSELGLFVGSAKTGGQLK